MRSSRGAPENELTGGRVTELRFSQCSCGSREVCPREEGENSNGFIANEAVK
jgi:hypothetical protein